MRLALLLFLFFSDVVFACPGCAGSMENSKDNYVVLILAIFILLTYIPFYFLYRMIIKNRHINQRPHE